MEISHLTVEQLHDYFCKMWLPEQEREIEVHISQCDICAKLATEVHRYLDGEPL